MAELIMAEKDCGCTQAPMQLVYVNILAGIGFGIGALILGIFLRYVLGIKIGG